MYQKPVVELEESKQQIWMWGRSWMQHVARNPSPTICICLNLMHPNSESPTQLFYSLFYFVTYFNLNVMFHSAKRNKLKANYDQLLGCIILFVWCSYIDFKWRFHIPISKCMSNFRGRVVWQSHLNQQKSSIPLVTWKNANLFFALPILPQSPSLPLPFFLPLSPPETANKTYRQGNQKLISK